MPAVIVKEKCLHCQRFYAPGDIQTLCGGSTICPDCEEAWLKGLSGLSEFATGKVGCPVCRKSREELNILHSGPDIPMYMHTMDGTVIPMCEQCNEKIVPLQKQKFRDTQFGKDQKL